MIINRLAEKKILVLLMEVGSYNYFLSILESLPNNNNWCVCVGSLLSSYFEAHPLKNINIIKDERLFPTHENFSGLITSLTGKQLEFLKIKEFNLNNKPTLGFIDYWSNFKGRVEKFEISKYAPSYLMIIDEQMKMSLSSYTKFLKSTLIHEVGHPYYERIDSCTHVGEEVFGVFIDQPISSTHGESLGYNEVLIWDYLKKKYNNKLKIILHPNTNFDKNLFTSEQIYQYDSSKLGAKKVKVFGMFSSLMIDFYLSGHDVLSIQIGLKAENHDYLSRNGWISLKVAEDNFIEKDPVKNPDLLRSIFKASFARVVKTIEGVM